MLPRIEQESVVPVLGPDLLSVTDDGGREILLQVLLAKKLAEALGVSAAGLPPGLELPEVARRHFAKSNDVLEIYRSLRTVVRELEPIPIPASLLQLAKISNFQLYVTTTFDVLVERAVDHERFDGQRQTLSFAYAPSDKQDLPPEFDRLNRPAVFHLMGRLSGTPHSYALTREDTFEFMHSLESKTEDSPGFLFDRLRRSDLLIIGSRRADWLARLLRPEASRSRSFEIEPDKEEETDAKSSPVLFLPGAGLEPEASSSSGAAEFVDELYRRWSELELDPASQPPPSLGEFFAAAESSFGAVLLSSIGADFGVAETLRDALDRAGVDVVLDRDDLRLARKWEMKLRSLLGECALFVPVVSRRALAAERRFFRPAWIEAILEARKSVPSGRFILPVAIDDTSADERAIPEAFGELLWERLRGGKPSPKLVKTVVELQRSYRSARFV